MIDRVNTLLFPVENFIKRYQSKIGYLFLGISFLTLPLIFFPESIKPTGEQSMNILLFILFLPIFAKVFSLNIARVCMPLRKEIGILMGTLAFVHGAGYIFQYPSFILDQSFWWQDGMITYFFAGFIALVFTIPLLITSNTWAIKMLGKKWKLLHRGAYIILIFTILHVVLLKWSIRSEVEYGQLILLVLYFIGKGLEWKGIKIGAKKISIKGQKWLCVPCGFIYDPLIGDTDSGIAPGTEFDDIPSDWKCPVCGVSKSDFVPYEEGVEEVSYSAKIAQSTLLNQSTLELVIEVSENWKSIPGQFMKFIFQDTEGKFTRMYSIVEQHQNFFTFTIKLSEFGRGAKYLKNIRKGDVVNVGGIFGSFTLKYTKNPKIFIASGTGLAPIYHMLQCVPKGIKKSLYFCVSTEQELFYVDKLRSIDSLDLHIHISREKVDGFIEGRIDTNLIDTDENSEWYICGNPSLLKEAREKLGKRNFDKVYFEEF